MQMCKPNQRGGVAARLTTRIKTITGSPARFLSSAACALLLLALMAVPAFAQTNETVDLSAVPQLVTEPLNFTGSATIALHVHIANGSNEVDLSVSGLPTGASGSFDRTAFTGSGNANLTLNLNNVAGGVYNFSVNAANGATNHLLIPLQVGDFWSGASGSSLNWSDAGNWNGGIVPANNDGVVFTAAGATTNSVTTNYLPIGLPITSIVDQNTTIASLRFAQYSPNLSSQNLQIDPNVTLSIIGTNGFTMLPDYINDTNAMYVAITGASGTLAVSNESASVSTLVDNYQPSGLNLSGLAEFKADVNQVGFGDYLLYPNFFNLQSNAYDGKPYRYVPQVSLARTNIIKAVYVDPYNYTNGTNRAYGFIFGNNENTATSGSLQLLLKLGISNDFLMDSFCIGGHGAEGSSVIFNPALEVVTNIAGSTTNYLTNTMVAVFRNTNGGRMSMFCLADAAGPVPAGDNTKANQFNGVDFASYNGHVDALVDRFIMARDIWNSADGGTAQAKMELGAGIFDANTAILGDQEHGNQTNTDYCQATLIVSNTAVFKVNQDMELGYTTADASDASIPGDTYGKIFIGPGGTVIANNIGVGGTTKASGEVGTPDIHGGLNEITLTGGAMLVVSNNIGDNTLFPDGGLGLFSFGGNSTLELFVNGNHTGPYVYVNNLTTSGSGNVIQIGGVTNLALPATVPLIQYAAGTPNFTVSLPPGYSGTLINNGAGSTIDLQITAGSTKSLVWRGYVNTNWDTTTKNWLDLKTGLHTNFASLDNVSFDDAAGVPTTINLAVSDITPGVLTMTNSTHNYVIGGPGSIVGSAPMTKAGTGSLDIEGNTTLSVTVDQGLLTGSGTIFSANIGSGGTMLYSGTISGNVACAGTGTSSGTISGSLDVGTGGVFTNLNTLNGPFTLETGAFLDNSGSINDCGPTNTVGGSAFLLNIGSISDSAYPPSIPGGTLRVYGTLEDESGSSGITMMQVIINSGATFIPGGDGIGSTYIYSDGVGNYPGRLTFEPGSTTVIKVNPGHSPENTAVYTGAQDYGPSQSIQEQNGGTLVLTNIGATPFAAGQVFNIFGTAYGSFTFDSVVPTGASTNSFPIIVPSRPGPGLSWDLSQLWPNGYIGVITTPVVTLTNSFTLLGSTNIVASFSWPTDRYGWVLEMQANPLSVGLSTNWTRVPGTWTNTQVVMTNSLATTNGAVFYRLVYP